MSMRVIFGIILGVLLTIGGAYLYDSRHAITGTPTASTQKTLVNWGVANSKWNTLTSRARNEWTKLAGR